MNYPLNTVAGATHASLLRVAVLTSALAVLVTGATSPLSAQTTAAAAAKEDPVKLEAFISTGTRFNDRTVAESPVPIDIITTSDINTGGYTETAQILQTLVPSFNY